MVTGDRLDSDVIASRGVPNTDLKFNGAHISSFLSRTVEYHGDLERFGDAGLVSCIALQAGGIDPVASS